MELIHQESEFIHIFTSLYYLKANQADKEHSRDNQACLKIQSAFRMHTKRKEFLIKLKAAIRIQTFVRGWRARKLVRNKRIKETNRKNLIYFGKQAIVIQKMFRGFYVREYVHNFYLRKEELQALEKKNEEFKKELEAFGKAQEKETEEYQKEQAKSEFKSLARNLHHLTSTKGIPGVYNSPFALQKPSVFEQTVEEHLQNEFKASYKWKPPRKEDVLKYSLKPEARKLK